MYEQLKATLEEWNYYKNEKEATKGNKEELKRIDKHLWYIAKTIHEILSEIRRDVHEFDKITKEDEALIDETFTFIITYNALKRQVGE